MKSAISHAEIESETIAVLAEQVAQAKAERDRLKLDRQAKNNEVQRLESWVIARDPSGKPLYVGRDGQPLKPGDVEGWPRLLKVGTPAEIAWAYTQMQKAESAYRVASEAYIDLRHELRQARQAQHQAEWPIERLQAEMARLVALDESLFGQLEEQILALREQVYEFNLHVDAKIALRKQLNERSARPVVAGMIGRVDSRWTPWLLANCDDERLHRQFDLLAHGKGHLNPLPSGYLEAARDAQSAQRKQLAQAEAPLSEPGHFTRVGMG